MRKSQPILITAMMLFLAGMLSAQHEASITTARIQQGNPEVRFTMRVLCDGAARYDMSKADLSILDNGNAIENFSIVESANLRTRKNFSVAIVLDCSGSMMGAGRAGAVDAGKAFIDYMDGSIDEASVIFFNQNVIKYQLMVTLKVMLNAAMDAVFAYGATALWDATLVGIDDVAMDGVNAVRAVLVLTDGMDNSSTSTPTDVIATAKQNGIRVFTVGLGDMINRSELKMVAHLTGGLFFETPDPSELRIIFSEIASFIGRSYDEYTIAYRTPQPNAEGHEISVRVRGCHEVATVSRSFEAQMLSSVPSGTARNVPVEIQLSGNVPNPVAQLSGTVIPYSVGGSGAPIPVRLEIFDLLGRRVAVLVDGEHAPGNYTANFIPSGLSGGLYMYRLSSGSTVRTRSMLVLN